MNKTKKLCLILGGFFTIATLVIAIIAFQLKPTLSAEYLDGYSASINNPSINMEQLRSIATKAHTVLIACFKALDSAIELLLTFTIISATGFFYIGFINQNKSP